MMFTCLWALLLQLPSDSLLTLGLLVGLLTFRVVLCILLGRSFAPFCTLLSVLC